VQDEAEVGVYLDETLTKTQATPGTFQCGAWADDGTAGGADPDTALDAECFAGDPVHPGAIVVTAGFANTDLPGLVGAANCRHSLKVEIVLDDLQKLVQASRIPLQDRARAWFYRYDCYSSCPLSQRSWEYSYSPTSGVLLVDAAGPTTFEFRWNATFALDQASEDMPPPPQRIEVRAGFYSCQVMEVESCGI